MSDTNETIADIIAEMRSDANADEYTPDGILGQTLNCLADRLDAAHKREIDEAERRANHAAIKNVSETIAKVGPLYDAESIGNAAKLREALVSAIGTLKKLYAPSERTAGHIVTCRQKCESALAEPPRNCDRFGSSTQARAEWYKTEVLPRVEGVVSGVEPPFVDWLFAFKTEKEGGNDGR